MIVNHFEGYFKAGLKAILLEKNSELKAMRETKAGIEQELEKGNAALMKAHEKTNELNDLLHFATNHNQTEPVDVKKPRAMVPTLRVSNQTKIVSNAESASTCILHVYQMCF